MMVRIHMLCIGRGRRPLLRMAVPPPPTPFLIFLFRLRFASSPHTVRASIRGHEPKISILVLQAVGRASLRIIFVSVILVSRKSLGTHVLFRGKESKRQRETERERQRESEGEESEKERDRESECDVT